MAIAESFFSLSTRGVPATRSVVGDNFGRAAARRGWLGWIGWERVFAAAWRAPYLADTGSGMARWRRVMALGARLVPCSGGVARAFCGSGACPVVSRFDRTGGIYHEWTRQKERNVIKTPAQRPPIAFADYCRICNVIFTVIEDHTDPHHACICFAMMGAHLLREHYKLNAIAVSGAAAYALGQQYKVLTFGRIENGRLVAASDAFHCWVECKGYVLDFLAPLFPDNLAEDRDHVEPPPLRVWMKPLSEMSPALPQRESAAGVFQLVANNECTEHMLRSFYQRPASKFRGREWHFQ
jgi:Protein of unknown function (DUF2026)